MWKFSLRSAASVEVGESYFVVEGSNNVLRDVVLRGNGFGRDSFLNGLDVMTLGRNDGESGELLPKKCANLDGESKFIVMHRAF